MPSPRNLAPDRFVFWTPPAGASVCVGADRLPLSLPSCPLPLHVAGITDPPADNAVGQGVYDYLRQFPDCEGNVVYAELLRDAFPYFIDDLAAHAVMLDAKEVEPAYVLRKLNCLKILRLLDPRNPALLAQLCSGFFDLALDLAELVRCRAHLLDAMRFGQDLLTVVVEDPRALSILAEIDLLLGDAPSARDKWRRLARQIDDPATLLRIEGRIAQTSLVQDADSAPVDDLESLAEAMNLHARGASDQAVFVLERLEEAGRLTTLFPVADFYYLLGLCRRDSGDGGGAVRALHQALEIEPGHAATLEILAAL